MKLGLLSHAMLLSASSFLALRVSTASASSAHSGLASYYPYPHSGYVTAARHVPRGSTLQVWDPRHPMVKLRVRVVDSGPYVKGRILDLSKRTYVRLYGSLRSGVAPVRYRVIHRVQQR